ncbi:MAG: phenylalanine--tRNA ligase subunit alpha [Minisyncoccota bacterium]
MLSEKIHALELAGLTALASVGSMTGLDAWEVTYLGRRSELSALLKGLKDLTPEERRVVGPLCHKVKQSLNSALAEVRETLLEQSIDWNQERIDVTAPGISVPRGHLHPLTCLEHEIEDIFLSMGFVIADGPELETEWYNFDALNVPANHPARDMQDTFWIQSAQTKKVASTARALAPKKHYLLRTHTSPVQVRFMETHKPPFRVIVPGRIFRNEATDASHEHTFHQFECLMVDTHINVAHFKFIAQEFFTCFFGKKISIRLRPSFFPFTEPSFEFDINCVLCAGQGCPVCKQTGWLEIGGAGIVNQKVFEAGGYKRGAYQGFAWGFGTTRLAMMKYQISDIRLLMSGDLRFIRQF